MTDTDAMTIPEVKGRIFELETLLHETFRTINVIEESIKRYTRVLEIKCKHVWVVDRSDCDINSVAYECEKCGTYRH